MDSPPLHIVGIDHLLLKVGDLETALSFYVGVLGCAIKSRLPQYGMAELSAGSQGLDLVDVGVEEGAWAGALMVGGNVHHLCLAVAAEEAPLRTHLVRHGATIVEERVEDGHLSLYVADPFGNQVELRFPQRP